MKPFVLLLAAAALAACAPPPPEPPRAAFPPAQGVAPRPQVHSIPARPAATAQPGDPAAREIAQAALASVAPGRLPGGDGAGAPLAAPMASGPLASAGPAPMGSADPAQLPDVVLSPEAALTRDEVLDMDTARRTRDAEREAFEQRRAAFEEVAPTALPDRPAEAPNIVAFALRTTNQVGQPVHRRSALTIQNTARNCAQFASPNDAQEEFLRRGGPERDPLNLDPDGDGFACGWDPAPFRAAARAGD